MISHTLPLRKKGKENIQNMSQRRTQAGQNSKQAKWNWSKECQKVFDTIEKLVSRETLHFYPNFIEPFVIHTDASKLQIGVIISQHDKPIAFYGRKVNSAQLNYTTTERELLYKIETLKEYNYILLGQQIKVYTHCKNLT